LAEALSAGEVALRLGLAALLAAVLGLEREARSKPAGLRTHMMVAVGAACFTLTAIGMAGDLIGVRGVGPSDVVRVVQGVIGGIGFLGAGTILHTRGSVKGLTTACSIWLVGAIGVACGDGRFVLAAITVGIAGGILVLVGWLERRVQNERS